MTDFNNNDSVVWFPVMPKYSQIDTTNRPGGRRFRLQYGHLTRWLTPEKLAEHAGVSVKTAYKWIAGTHPMDERTRQLLHLKVLGLLPDPRWSTWHVDERGRLTAPNGWSFYPDELLHFSLTKQLNAELQADVARLNVENQRLREAIDYLQENRLPSNVVPLPLGSRPETKKRPG